LADAPGDGDVPEPFPPPAAAGAEVSVPIDCVAAPAVLDGGALVHPVAATAARTATAASAPARVVLEPFISEYLVVARC
jgi:hypothetical protein